MARGPHAADPELFGDRWVPVLRSAVADLSWLLGHGYAETSSLQLVGDRYRLRQRQRLAVRRCACSDAAREDRLHRRLPAASLQGKRIAIDGFNCIITVESAMGGGVLLRGRDGALRDLASVHGSYRRAEVTHQALIALGTTLRHAGARDVLWYLDRPVSNSGRLRDMILASAPEGMERWEVELPFDPDRCLIESDAVVASSDSIVLDGGGPWTDLPGAVVQAHVADAWLLDLSDA